MSLETASTKLTNDVTGGYGALLDEELDLPRHAHAHSCSHAHSHPRTNAHANPIAAECSGHRTKPRRVTSHHHPRASSRRVAAHSRRRREHGSCTATKTTSAGEERRIDHARPGREASTDVEIVESAEAAHERAAVMGV